MKLVSIVYRKSRYFYAENMGLVYIIDLDIFVYYLIVYYRIIHIVEKLYP
jgi:hypothetical protein